MNYQEVLGRGVDKVLPTKEGLQELMRTRKIRLYQGFDPTGFRLHLGHTIGLRKLMEFSQLGHEVIFLFGTATVLVGDPSQRDTGRKLITQEEIKQNIKDWKNQISPIVDFSKVKIKQNGDWLLKLKLQDIINIASKISAIQLFKRDMFQRRLKKGDTVWYHETMYPLLQGYDSVAMDVDLEIGGSDQEFNMLIGRELQKKMKNREKFVLTTPMILGTDGKQMSKTSGNCIWLDDSPQDMYGKLMRIPDEHIESYMELLTTMPLPDLKEALKKPLESKKRLALDVTSQFHGKLKSQKAQKNFQKTVQDKKVPENVENFSIPKGSHSLFAIVSLAFPNQSHSQIKRVIKQGGVEWNGNKVTDPNQLLDLIGGETLKYGKRLFKKSKVKK